MLKPPTRKTRKSPKTLIFFVSLFSLAILLQVIATFTHIALWQVILNLALTVSSLTSLAITSSKDPGHVKNEKVPFLALLEVCDSTDLCSDCFAVRTTRSRHCAVCNKCVERFDHHCPWVNNCVGLKNHAVFLFFVTSMLLTLIVVFS